MRVNKARLSLPSFMFRPIQKAAFWIIGRIKAAISGFSKRASGMPVPSSMGDLSVTESSNSPSGSDAISTGLDNYLRAIQAIVRSTNHKGADIASAASVAIGASTGEFLTVTGTTTITSFDSVSAGIVRTVQFSGALTLTHSSNLQLPGSVNYTTTAGDVLQFRSLGSGQWKCVAMLNPQAILTEASASEAYGMANSAKLMTTRRLRDVYYAGRVNSAGTAFVASSANMSGWSVARGSAGFYVVTHNLTLSNEENIIVTAVPSDGTSSAWPIVTCRPLTSSAFQCVFLDAIAGVGIDTEFSFIAIRVGA